MYPTGKLLTLQAEIHLIFLGGTSHTLNPSNTLASEMDGATRPTWDPNNFAIPADVRRWMHGME